MCIVADSVDDVSKTKIASFRVAYTLDNGKTVVPSQLVVYSANVDSLVANNAFILPVHTVGDYQFSMMPLKTDFDRLDCTKLNINPEARASIDIHFNDYMKRFIHIFCPNHIFCPKMFIPKKNTIKGSQPNRNLTVDNKGYQYYQDLKI